MSKIENENVEIQATEVQNVEVKEGFFKRAGRWIADHKVGLAITAGVATVVAVIGGVLMKKANEDDTDETEAEEDDFEFEDELVETEE